MLLCKTVFYQIANLIINKKILIKLFTSKPIRISTIFPYNAFDLQKVKNEDNELFHQKTTKKTCTTYCHDID